MTLEYFVDNMELFNDCMLWFKGDNQTNLGFPILPANIAVTPVGTWSNDLNLGNSKNLKTFDGSTNYIGLTSSTIWNVYSGNFTFLLWFYYTDTQYRYYISQYSDYTLQWGICKDGTNAFYLWGFYASSSKMFDYGSNSVPSISVGFHHLVVQRSGTSCIMYLDGIPQTVTAYTAWNNIASINASLQIGVGESTSFYIGSMKDLMLFNRVLTQSEIVTLMKLTSPVLGRDVYPVYPGIRGVE